MFATDRDLLVLEPNLFRNAAPAGQRLLKGTCDISGTTLTLTAQDVDLAAANIGPGHVALVDGTPYEVLARLTSATATVSRPRASTTDAAQAPSPATGAPVEIWTFAPQIAGIHAVLLRMLGIEPQDPPTPDQVTEQSITNPASLAHIEALGTIYAVYSTTTLAAASGSGGWAHTVWSRAQQFRELFESARQLAAARIDTNGDGIPDATRRFNALILTRA